MSVLEPCKLPDSVDIKKIKKSLEEYMTPRKEFYEETSNNLEIEDVFSEWWVSKSSDGKRIGKGSSGMDVKTSTNDGIDVTCLIMNKHISNEKSLMQNFGKAGLNLDSLFAEKKDEEALSLYLEGYTDKINKTKEKNSLNDLYILSFISGVKDVHLLCFKLNIDLIRNVKSDGFKSGFKTIKTKNFIDEKYGNVCLYKSKKRLELRLNKSCLENEHSVKIYSLTPPAKEESAD